MLICILVGLLLSDAGPDRPPTISIATDAPFWRLPEKPRICPGLQADQSRQTRQKFTVQGGESALTSEFYPDPLRNNNHEHLLPLAE